MAKPARARFQETSAGFRSAKAAPMTSIRRCSRKAVYSCASFSRSARTRYSGPLWVWEALSRSDSGGSWCAAATFSSMLLRRLGRMPIRSVVTKTKRFPAASSRTSALAKRSCTLPSAGFFLPAYPAIHMWVSGVMTTWAAPALSGAGAGESAVCASVQTATTGHSAKTKGHKIFIQTLRAGSTASCPTA